MHEECAERFWAKVQKLPGEDACWEWTAATNRAGYGNFYIKRWPHGAHRVSWEIANRRKVPDGLVVRHRCDNPSCVQPKHLVVGTQAANIRDCIDKGRFARGEGHVNAKLTEQAVHDIRTSSNTQDALATRYGVSQTLIGKVMAGKVWAHVGG